MKTNWQIKPISKCLQNIPKLGSLLRSDYLKDGKFPVIDQGQDFIAGYTDNESLVFKNCLPVIIFGDHTRALKFIDFPFAVGADGTKILKPSDEFDPRFFYYMLQSLDLGSRGYARHFKLLKEQEIPLPPLATQQKIVARLDELLGNIAEVKQLRQEAIADTEKILSQTLREIFEEGKEKGWEEDVLNNIAKKVADGTHDTPKYTTEGYPLITSKNLLESGLDFSNVKYISEKDYIQIGQRSGVEKGDLLIAMIGTIGNVTIVETDEKFSIKNVGLIKPNEDRVLGKYILYFLHNSRLLSLIEAKGATQKFIALGPIRNIKIQFPPLSEQNEIVTRLDTLSAKLRELRQLQAEQLEDLKKLEKAYLREAFSGELV